MPRGPISQVILVSVKLTIDTNHHRGDTADFLSGMGVSSAQPSPFFHKEELPVPARTDQISTTVTNP